MCASGDFDFVDTLAVDRIVKWSWALNGVVGAAALLLPLPAAPESHIQAPTTSSTSSAAAHVNFKIIIPSVLYLQVSDSAAVATVAVMSNSRNLALTTTVRSPAGSAAGNVILSAAARKTIAQDGVCPSPAGAAGKGAASSRVICTASMP
jgi:hypothetical protein